MELRHLRYFVAVAEELHFRRAAERLHVAQPAVSEQVRKLELELGVTLLERTHRSVSLTEAGAVMLADAKRVLRLAEGAKLAARDARDRVAARLRLGYAAAALPAAVPRALQAIRLSGTGTEITLQRGFALELIEAVRDHHLDAAVVPLPAGTNGLRVTRLGEQHALAALPLSHPRAMDRSISLGRAAPERLIVLPREANRPFYDAVVAACHDAGVSPSLVELPEGEVEQALLAVAAGAGMVLLPESVAERYSAPGARFVPLKDPRPSFATGVVTRQQSNHPPTLSLLRILSSVVSPPRSAPVPEPLTVVAA